ERRRKVESLLAERDGAGLATFASDARSRIAENRIGQSRQKIEGKYYAKEVADDRLPLDYAIRVLAARNHPRALAVLIATVSLLPETKVFGAIVNSSNE